MCVLRHALLVPPNVGSDAPRIPRHWPTRRVLSKQVITSPFRTTIAQFTQLSVPEAVARRYQNIRIQRHLPLSRDVASDRRGSFA